MTPEFPTPEEINRANSEASTGKVADDGGSPAFYSSRDVKKMSRAQVKANYDRILLSMKSGRFDD